jgi:epoxide hydrolase 4
VVDRGGARLSHALAVLAVVASSLATACGAADSELDLADIPGPWENQQIEVPGRVETADGTEALEFHLLVAGPAGAPTVVLLHGFPDLAYSWREVIPLLSDDFRVVAPDLRGYGATGKPESGYDAVTLADDVAALIEVVAPGEPVHLVGHDWGAFIAWSVAIRHPGRLATLTAVDVPHPATMEEFLREDREQRRKSRYMKLLASKPAARVVASLGPKRRGKMLRSNLTRAEGLTDEDVAWYQAAFDSVEETRGPLLYYREALALRKAAAGEPIPDAPVAVPTLVMWGEDDAYVGSVMAEPSCEHVTADRCEVEIFEGAGHFLQWEAPEGFVERWRRFVGP